MKVFAATKNPQVLKFISYLNNAGLNISSDQSNIDIVIFDQSSKVDIKNIPIRICICDYSPEDKNNINISFKPVDNCINIQCYCEPIGPGKFDPLLECDLSSLFTSNKLSQEVEKNNINAKLFKCENRKSIYNCGSLIEKRIPDLIRSSRINYVDDKCPNLRYLILQYGKTPMTFEEIEWDNLNFPEFSMYEERVQAINDYNPYAQWLKVFSHLNIKSTKQKLQKLSKEMINENWYTI